MAEFVVVETWSKSVRSSPCPPPCPFYFAHGMSQSIMTGAFPFQLLLRGNLSATPRGLPHQSLPNPITLTIRTNHPTGEWRSSRHLPGTTPWCIFPMSHCLLPSLHHGQRRIMGNRAKLIGRHSLLYSLKFWNTSWGGKEHRSTSMVRMGRLFYQNVGSSNQHGSLLDLLGRCSKRQFLC